MTQAAGDNPGAPPRWSAHGLPADRQARIAARQDFVDLKTCLMRIAADLAGPHGRGIQQRVRQACEAVELWKLRSVIVDTLPAVHPRTAQHRHELQRRLDRLFPDSEF